MNLKYLLLFAALFVRNSVAQPIPPASPEADGPRAVIADVKVIPNEGLLFAVRLHAPKTNKLVLARQRPKRASQGSKQEGDDDAQPFSLAGSTLKDLYTDKVYTSLPTIPSKPFVGPIEVITDIRPGGWLQLGVAFPAIEPPPDKDGKKQAYQLLFEVPELKIKTVLKLDPETLKPL